METVKALRTAEEAHLKLQGRTQLLESQMADMQLSLNNECSKYQSACHQQVVSGPIQPPSDHPNKHLNYIQAVERIQSVFRQCVNQAYDYQTIEKRSNLENCSMVTRSTRPVEVSSWYPMLLPVHAGPAEVLGGEDRDCGAGEGGAAKQVGEERGAAEPAPGSTEPRDRGEEDTAGSVRPPAGTTRCLLVVRFKSLSLCVDHISSFNRKHRHYTQ